MYFWSKYQKMLHLDYGTDVFSMGANGKIYAFVAKLTTSVDSKHDIK